MANNSTAQAARSQRRIDIFAALGEKKRLRLVTELIDNGACSISQLTENSTLTRQAITRHLQVLEDAGIVESSRSGREIVFKLDPHPLQDAGEYLNRISQK